jgi:hypothetical protein
VSPGEAASLFQTMHSLISFRKSTPPQIVNLSFTITNIKNKLTNLCGNRLVQNTLCDMKVKVLQLAARRLQVAVRLFFRCSSRTTKGPSRAILAPFLEPLNSFFLVRIAYVCPKISGNCFLNGPRSAQRATKVFLVAVLEGF